MTIKNNVSARLLDLWYVTTPRSKTCAKIECAQAITLVALLIIVALALLKVGHFAKCSYAQIVGLSCLGVVCLFTFVKTALLSLGCCNMYLVTHARYQPKQYSKVKN